MAKSKGKKCLGFIGIVVKSKKKKKKEKVIKTFMSEVFTL